VTYADLVRLVDQYRLGIEAQLRLLGQLESIAARQRDVTVARNFEAFGAEADERDNLTRSLVTLEEHLRPLRRQLTEHRRDAELVPGFARVAERHRQASELVTRILTTDHDSFRALADADLARRAALSGLEQGEMTLAAYRKVLAPSIAHPALVDERG